MMRDTRGPNKKRKKITDYSRQCKNRIKKIEQDCKGTLFFFFFSAR